MATDISTFALYKDRKSFELALEALRAAQFRNSDVSAVLPERDQTTRDLAQEVLKTTGGHDIVSTSEATADYRP